MSNIENSNATASPAPSSSVASSSAIANDPTTQAGAASSNSEMVKMTDKISNMDDLRKKAPKVYQQMLLGIATNICSEMNRQQERLKRIMREGQSA